MSRFFLLSFYLIAAAQIVSIPYVLSSKKEIPNEYDVKTLPFYQTPLSYGFNGFDLLDTAVINRLKQKTIYKVELVYTKFRVNEGFSQEQLNSLRLAQLQKQMPFLFENNAIEWVLVEQQEADNRDKAAALFHGFVFYSREPGITTKDGRYLKIGTAEEIDIIKSMLHDTMAIDYETMLPIHCDPVVTDTVIKTISTDAKHSVPTGLYYPRRKHKKERGILYKRAAIWHRKKQEKEVYTTTHRTDTLFLRLGKVYEKDFRELISRADGLTYYSLNTDTVVLKILRKHYREKVLLVEDVTGSMYPYLTQTFLWRRLYITATKGNNYAFFNDGDDKPDGPVGKSFGEYYIHSDSIGIVENRAYSAMRLGSGGAGPENNIEASVRAKDDCNYEINRILMVADNYAPVRDMEIFPELIKKNIPVDVIVCGALYGTVNYQYIDIARKTGGSVYTMEEELTNLAALTEGMSVTIGKQKFVLRKGELKLER